MKVKGKIFVFGDDINTDEIIPARFLNTHIPEELAKYCMEDARPGFGQRDDIKGSIIVAGENFGCGSSREHAPISIKAAGISCVIAKSFARIFLRNCINIGLPIVELKDIDGLEEGDVVEVDFDLGTVKNNNNGKEYEFNSYPDFVKQIVLSGGWINYSKKLAGGNNV